MKLRSPFWKLVTYTLTIFSILITSSFCIFPAQKGWAIVAEPVTLISSNGGARYNPPLVSSSGGSPTGRREGAGSSGTCQIGSYPGTPAPRAHLVALVPVESGENTTYVWGRTTVDRPTLWFYVAYQNNPEGELVLQDDTGETIGLFSRSLGETSGIVAFKLPRTNKSLEDERLYHWFFKIRCNPQGSTDDFVEGWIQKVQLNSQPQSQSAGYFAENGVWYDALNSAIDNRSSCPLGRVSSPAWSELLQQVNLSALSDVPITQCDED